MHVSACVCALPALVSLRTLFRLSDINNLSPLSLCALLCVRVCVCVSICMCACVCTDFEEQLYDTKLTGQTFRHPSSQSSDDTSTSLSRSPVSLNNKRADFIFLVIHTCTAHTHTLAYLIMRLSYRRDVKHVAEEHSWLS